MMSAKRLEQALSGQSTTARKVYEATPIEEYWSTHRVISQLGRNGASTNPAVVTACLDCLKRSGLVLQSADGWRRAPVKLPQEKKGLADLERELAAAGIVPQALRTASSHPQPTKEPMTAQSNQNPVDWLSNISQRMNALAVKQQGELTDMISRHRADMESLAHEVADAAIEVQAQMESGSAEVAAARQLKALLAKIG